MARSLNVARLTVVVLLVWGAYWAALPWLDCLREFPAEVVRACTFGLTSPVGPPPLGSNLIVGAIYVVAATWVASRRWV